MVKKINDYESIDLVFDECFPKNVSGDQNFIHMVIFLIFLSKFINFFSIFF